MKITNGISPVGAGSESSRTKATAQSPRQAPASAGDQVELSSLAAQLQSASAATAEPIDLARIAEIKQAIVEGRFEVNPERIAEGLIESTRDILAGKG